MHTRIGGVPEHFNLPWEAAVEALSADGWLCSWRAFPDGSGAMARALATREIDVAVMLTTSTVKAISDGLPARVVGSHVTSPLRWGIHVAANSKIHRPEEIRGRPIAISRFGSGSHLVPIVDARLRGWPTDDMEFVEVVDLEGACDALTGGRAEVFFWEQFMTQPRVDAGILRRVDVRLPPWPAFLVVAHQDWLASSPDIRGLLARVDERCARLSKDAEATVELIHARFGIERSGARKWLESTQWQCVPRVSLDALRAAGEHLAFAFGVPQPDPASLVEQSVCDFTDSAEAG